MRPSALGRYLLYDSKANFVARGPLGDVVAAQQPNANADFKVNDAGSGAFRIVLTSAGKELSASGPGGKLVLADPGGPAGAVQLPAHQRLRHLPGGRDQHRGHARPRAHPLRRGEGLPRRPHAHDGLRVPRRQRALRPAVEPLRRDGGAGGLPRPLPQRRRCSAGERALQGARAHARPGGLADLQGLAPPQVTDPRGLLLQVAGARLARRAAQLREPVRGERAAVRALPAQAQQLQRDGCGAPAGARHPGARGLHRRPERRPGQGLVPDRDRPRSRRGA